MQTKKDLVTLKKQTEKNLTNNASKRGQRQSCPPQPSLLTLHLPIPSMEELRVDYTTSATNMDIPSWLSYHLVHQILGK